MVVKETRDAHLRRRLAELVLALAALLLATLAQAAVELELDRDRVVAGETVTLVFRTDDPRQSLDADFSVLDADFEVLDRRSETQLSIVNGRQAAVVRLLLTVEPRRAGTLTIPSFDFDGARTEPASLVVEPAPQLAPGELPPVFLEVELTPEDGPYYVHAQFGLVVRVFYQQNLTEAAIGQPEPSPAAVRLLQETPYQAERGGERYRVLERVYAVFPERSGELVIPPMELSGRLVERGAAGVWQPAVRGRRIRVASEPLTLTIEPRPDAFSGDHWLPARDLKIAQQISASDALRVGEPVTRTVLIDAVGLEENMITEPAWPDLADARIYPDKPQGITRDDGRWVLGHKEFRYAVVPEREGELVLPELRVEWWDTRDDVQRVAVLPAHTVRVQASTLAPPAPPVSADASPVAPRGADVVAGAPATAGPWPWLTALFSVLWLATTWAWWRARKPAGPVAAPAATDADTELLDALQRACRAGDRAAARRSLRAWLRRHGPGRDGSLLEFAATVDDAELRGALQSLDADGFRPGGSSDWDGRELWRRLEEWRRRRDEAARRERAPLSDLYARRARG